MKIIFIGAPGAGKGTQAENVSRIYNIPAISTGAMLREAIKEGTELGKTAKSIIERGELVPDEIIIGIIKDRVAMSDCENGFILDGFPRTVPQAEAYDKMGGAIDGVIEIYVPDEEIIERMSGRRVCPKCGASYHVLYNPSEKDNCCDKCGEVLTIRADDEPETVKNRLDVYHKQTEPLKEYYEKAGKLIVVRGQKELKDTTKLTLEAVEQIKKRVGGAE